MAGKSRRAIIAGIDRPLGFYVLALLIVEAFIATVVGIARLTDEYLFRSLVIGVGMFVYVTLTVTVLVWNKAHLLTYDRDAHLRDRRAPFGTERNQVKDADSLPPGKTPESA